MFESDLTTTNIDGRTVKLSVPLHYRTPHGKLIVPAGFVTDYATIPRFFWRLLPPQGDGPNANYGPAAVVHDYLYQFPHRLGCKAVVLREEADAIFYEAMRDLGVSLWRRWLMYRAVRAFGWIPWKRYRRREQN